MVMTETGQVTKVTPHAVTQNQNLTSMQLLPVSCLEGLNIALCCHTPDRHLCPSSTDTAYVSMSRCVCSLTCKIGYKHSVTLTRPVPSGHPPQGHTPQNYQHARDTSAVFRPTVLQANCKGKSPLRWMCGADNDDLCSEYISCSQQHNTRQLYFWLSTRIS